MTTDYQDRFLTYCFLPETGGHIWRDVLDRSVEKEMNYAKLRNLSTPCGEEERDPDVDGITDNDNEGGRVNLYLRIKQGRFHFERPFEQLIPKKHNEKNPDGTPKMRAVYVSPISNRVLAAVATTALFEMFPDFVHPNCMSYRKGISCGDAVKKISRAIQQNGGWQSDIRKYFDTVPLRYIDAVFDRIEARIGRDHLIDAIREFYHMDEFWRDYRKREIVHEYRSLKQGFAVAAFLADAILYPIDDAISQMDVLYIRYSDDQRCIGPDAQKAFTMMRQMFRDMDMDINEKKLKTIDAKHWQYFLGFAIKGEQISLCDESIDDFRRMVNVAALRGVKDEKTGKWSYPTFRQARHRVVKYLYNPRGEYGWATRVLRYINVKEDVQLLNQYVMDALRAAQTGHRKIGGIGYDETKPIGCIQRSTGRNVNANRQKTSTDIEGYYSINMMQKALRTSRPAYELLVRELADVV